MAKKQPGKRRLQRRIKKPGLPPGTLVYTGKFEGPIEGLTLIRFDENEAFFADLSEPILDFPDNKVSWYNLTGLNDVEMVDKVGDAMGLHRLLREDVLSTESRPKVEASKDLLFVSLKMLSLNEDGQIEQEHVSLVLSEHGLLTFQEVPKDVFNSIRERIRDNKGIVRSRGADYLLYLLMDMIVDNYFWITDALAERLENLEDAISVNTSKEDLSTIQEIRKELLLLRKAVAPLRDVVIYLQRRQSELIKEDTLPFFFDLSDHIFHVSELIESYREMVTGLKDMYLSAVSLQMNRIMQTLTVVSTIFIPLSFLVGVYGMNFDVMPELHTDNGYFILWGIMGTLALGMLALFKWRKWF